MQLCKERIFRLWRQRLQFISKNMDMVMWLYTLIPGGAFLYFLLRETVFRLQYGILGEMHSSLVVLVVLFCCSLLKSRIFVEPADQLFLIQHKQQFTQLKRFGFLYSLFIHCVMIALIGALSFPLFLYIHQFSIQQLVALLLSMFASVLLCDAIEYFVPKWVRYIVKPSIVIVLMLLVMNGQITSLFVLAALITVNLSLIEFFIVRKSFTFHQQVQIEAQRATRMFNFMLKMDRNSRAMKQSYLTKKAPKLFTQPRAKTAQGTLVELLLKSMWRNRGFSWNCLQLVGLSFIAILVLPLWVKLLVLLFSCFGLRGYLQTVSFEIKNEPIFTLLRFHELDWLLAIKKLKLYMMFQL